jgi:hypothetical protein
MFLEERKRRERLILTTVKVVLLNSCFNHSFMVVNYTRLILLIRVCCHLITRRRYVCVYVFCSFVADDYFEVFIVF